MIARIWRTRVDETRMKEFETFERERSTPMFRRQRGCLGVLFLRGSTEVAVLTLWEDQESIEDLRTSPSYRQTVQELEVTGLLQDEARVEVFEITHGQLIGPSFEKHLEKVGRSPPDRRPSRDAERRSRQRTDPVRAVDGSTSPDRVLARAIDPATSAPIAVVGAGAVGCYFGGMLARAGARVTFIGRRPHVDAMLRDGLSIESARFSDRFPVVASTNIENAREAAIVLLCVKAPDTEAAVRSLAPHLGSGALMVSLQNGVDNVERIRSVADVDVIPAAVYVSAEMTGPGRVKHSGRGDLVIGDLPPRDPGDEDRMRRLEEVASLFAAGDVPCRVSTNIEAELWEKLVMNCAYNAISALSRARYGPISRSPATRAVIGPLVEEVIAVGRAAGVWTTDVDLMDSVLMLGEAMPEAESSTARDIERGKRTEIASLNGYVARRGAELGIATPVNHTLHGLVRLLEERNE